MDIKKWMFGDVPEKCHVNPELPLTQSKILEIGCGGNPVKGYLHCDIRQVEHVEVICRGNELPFKENTFDKIYASGVFEHFSYKEAYEALQNWLWVLKPGGELDFNVPDMYRWAKYLIECEESGIGRSSEGGYNHMRVFMTIYGWQGHLHDFHKSGWTRDLIIHRLDEIGFEEMDIYKTYAYSGPADAHLCIRAFKPKGELVE